MEGFEEFWTAYPKKLCKADARKAWEQTAKIRPDLSTLLAAIRSARQSDQWQRDAGRYVPYPATWLRGERWEDVYEVEVEVVDEWFKTASGIQRKARELGVAFRDDEPAPVVRSRVEAAIAQREQSQSRGTAQLRLVA